MSAALPAIPCSRHDSGENNPRVRRLLAAAAAEFAGSSGLSAALDDILRLHDHKGVLFVVSRAPLPAPVEAALRRIWYRLDTDLGRGFMTAAPHDDVWLEIWDLRRFESGWTGAAVH